MKHAPFEGPHIKVAQAKRHIMSLRLVEAEFFGSEPFERVVEPTEDGNLAYKVRLKERPPHEAVALTGDILGNLRAALDLAVCECARLSGATNFKNTYFHFAEREADWDKSAAGRMKAAPQRIRDLNRSFSPWRDGNPLLYALSRLVVADKHQLITPVAINTSQVKFESITAEQIDHLEIPHVQWDFDRNELIFLIVGPNTRGLKCGNVDLKAFFAFGDVEMAQHEPTIPILDKLGSVVEGIVAEFERAMR